MLKFLVLLLLAAILVSLFSGLFFLNRDEGDSRRMLRALTVRITLSVLLFVVLLIAWLTGAIQPHDLSWSAGRRDTKLAFVSRLPALLRVRASRRK